MGAQDVEKLLKLVKLTKSQQRSIDFMKMKAQQSIDTITQRITSGIITMVVQSDLNMWEAVKDVGIRGDGSFCLWIRHVGEKIKILS